MNIRWKIYFWILISWGIIGTTLSLFDFKSLNYHYLFSVPIFAINIIGLYEFAYKKVIFNKKFWKVYLILLLIYFIYTFLQLGGFHPYAIISLGHIFMLTFVLSNLIYSPLYYAIYKLGFGAKK